jgi:hypothetical protein
LIARGALDVILESMFTTRLSEKVCLGYQDAIAKSHTLQQALGFIGEFAALRHMLITTPWIEQDGRWVIEVYDWCDCWFTNPPVMARVTAPPEFTPPKEESQASRRT